jgi:hypothetical protein
MLSCTDSSYSTSILVLDRIRISTFHIIMILVIELRYEISFDSIDITLYFIEHRRSLSSDSSTTYIHIVLLLTL